MVKTRIDPANDFNGIFQIFLELSKRSSKLEVEF